MSSSFLGKKTYTPKKCISLAVELNQVYHQDVDLIALWPATPL